MHNKTTYDMNCDMNDMMIMDKTAGHPSISQSVRHFVSLHCVLKVPTVSKFAIVQMEGNSVSHNVRHFVS